MVEQIKGGPRRKNDIVTVEVITATPLSKTDKTRLRQRFADIVGRPVVLKHRVDTNLIGGMIVKLGNKLIDGSLRNKLTALKEELGNGQPIIKQPKSSYRGSAGTGAIEVITAIPRDKSEKTRLAQRLADTVGSPVVLKHRVDTNLIGGMVVKLGNKHTDGSLRNKLTKLKDKLVRRQLK